MIQDRRIHVAATVQLRRCAEKKTLVGKQSIPLILYAESKTAALTGAAVPLSFD